MKYFCVSVLRWDIRDARFVCRRLCPATKHSSKRQGRTGYVRGTGDVSVWPCSIAKVRAKLLSLLQQGVNATLVRPASKLLSDHCTIAYSWVSISLCHTLL
jgi:hypothetical protein